MLKTLSVKIADFKKNLQRTVEDTEREIEEANNILKKGSSTRSVREGTAPRGSFEQLREKLQAALDTGYQTLFPKAGYGPYICCMYTDSVVVETGNNYYSIPYQVDSQTVSFGNPVMVEKTFVLMESARKTSKSDKFSAVVRDVATELKESNIEIVEAAHDADLEMMDFIPLKEAKYDVDSGEVEVVLIEAGTNPKKKRHYPESTIQEAAPMFSGLKMYLNHPTKTEEKELPERDITKWASTIVESRYENGKAMATVAVHDKWLRERLADPVARQHIGLSINTGGRISKGKVNGQEMEIVEKIVLTRSSGPASVDWVTEAGARGRVSRLLKESNNEEDVMDIKSLDLATLKKERPDLLEAANRELKESGASEQKDKELKEAQAENARLKRENALRDQKEKVNALLKESKLPEIARNRVADRINANVFDSEEKLREAVAGEVKSELEYVNKLSPKGAIKMGAAAGQEKSTLSSLQESLDKRAGVAEKKEEGEE